MKKKKFNQVQLQTKILLAKSIIKNWNQATEKEKREMEQRWQETYGEFE